MTTAVSYCWPELLDNDPVPSEEIPACGIRQGLA